ncbi:hypothetical protein DMA11_23770 [Marinilabiliaceae bacterium JC017]|nr:hypothetical protein DMA11_23770 [Marinilabiliaceae bacterium JC017]
MNRLIFILAIHFISINAFAQIDSIPENVVYKKNLDVVNNKAKEVILQEIKNPSYSLFKDNLYCGPNFWHKYNYLPIKKGDITFMIPQPNGSDIEAYGKLIQTPENFKTVWDAIVKDFKNTKYKIRKLNPKELSYYWSIIFFDIEEPIYIVENQNQRIVFDFDPNNLEPKIIFIDIL